MSTNTSPATTLGRNTIATATTLAALCLASASALAQTTDHGSHSGHGAAPATALTATSASPATSAPATTAPASQDLSEGEVTRWDARTSKITLRHGEIKNIGMPPMTMVFTVQNPAQASAVKAGDKVRFRVADLNGALTITHIEATP